MKTNIPNLEIIGKETHYETDKGFILDNWDFGPDSLHESTSEDINPVFALAMLAVLVLLIVLSIIL